jgi:hypothetical protein
VGEDREKRLFPLPAGEDQKQRSYLSLDWRGPEAEIIPLPRLGEGIEKRLFPLPWWERVRVRGKF